MDQVPSLPPGPVGLLAVAGSIGLLAFLAVVIMEGVARRGRGTAWASAPLLIGVLTMVLGRGHPGWHAAASLLTLALGTRNAVAFRKWSRVASSLAVVSWLTAQLIARALFT
jgi:hypothetical protein